MSRLTLIHLCLLLVGSIAAVASEGNEHTTAFVNVNLVPMTHEIVVENQTVLIEGTRIIEVGSSDEVAVPEDATVINGAGAYLMPGLADMHTRDDWLSDVWLVSPLELFLANGVTTIRDFGPNGSFTYALRWRDEVKVGKLNGPTIYTSGKKLYGPADDPKATVEWNHAQGVHVKVMGKDLGFPGWAEDGILFDVG